MRATVIAGNWKMYKTTEEAVSFIRELIPQVKETNALVALAVPFTTIGPAIDTARETNIQVGAQNMNDASEGAFTGEISSIMLNDLGSQFVLLGHSERRHVFGEDNAFINRKVKRALADGIRPTLCIGETIEQREAGQTEEILKTQLTESLDGVTAEQLAGMWIAYEPVWAIGTGKTATPEQAQETHLFCRQYIAEQWGKEAADAVVIQYGGSVKPDNAKEILGKPDIDGVLVGGASLTADSFSRIVNSIEVQNYQTIQ